MLIDFGKYKGSLISEVPSDYLAWGAVYLSNRWKDIFKEKYYTSLHPKMYKYQVFLNTPNSFECISKRMDMVEALSLYKQVWGHRKTMYIDNGEDTIIYPQDLCDELKDVLDEWLDSVSTDMGDLELFKEMDHNRYRLF